MAPAPWVKRLVTLCDQAPATPYNVIRVVLEKEFGQSIDELFEYFDKDPLGSASIAQVSTFLLSLSFLLNYRMLKVTFFFARKDGKS